MGMTLAILVLLWLLMRELFILYLWPWIAAGLPGMPAWLGWIGFFTLVVMSLGLALIFSFLIAPITSFIGSFFMDEAADIIESGDYPDDPPGKAMPLGQALVISLRFLGVSIVGNLIALLLFFVPGVNLIAFYLVNGYLLGREYFEFAATRHRSTADAKQFYRQNSWTVFFAGILISVFISIPIINLVAPLFAAAMMTYLYKELSAKTK